MSHCSKFDFKFKDKHILFKAMRNLGMNPENKVWNSYKSTLGKLIGFNGTLIGKLLTGSLNNINIFFVEEEGIFTPYTESHFLTAAELKERGLVIIQSLQKEYIKCTLEALQNKLIMSGQSVSLTSENKGNSTTYTLEMVATGKKLIVSINEAGTVEEQVHGVIGRSCLDFTSMIEGLMTNNIEREWMPEYSEVIEDQVVQVLKLGSV